VRAHACREYRQLQRGQLLSGADYARVKRETAADRIAAVTGLLREVFADR